MPYNNIREVKDIQVIEWEVEGTFHIDTYYSAFNYYILVEDTSGERWVHEHVFANSDKAANFARKVENSGYINLTHWGFHEYFSLSLEQKLNQEAEYEDMHRRGCGDQVPDTYWGGLA